ncbi:MAG: PilZ domain-containing protein [Candidatus Omnitrophota bacterium]
MDNNEIKRKAKRIDVSYEVKIRFAGRVGYTTVALKDISVLGFKAIISGRLVKVGEILEIKMCIDNREIQCQGKITWVLMLRAGFGNITILDVGVAFFDMNIEDKGFLDKLIGE